MRETLRFALELALVCVVMLLAVSAAVMLLAVIWRAIL